MRHWMVGLMLLWGTASASSAQQETRWFQVRVGGKAAGSYTLQIRDDADGTTTVHAAAEVTVKVLLRTFRYSFRGSEVWQNDRLMQLDTLTNDDGKQHQVSLRADDNGLRLTSANTTVRLDADAWSTIAWRLPNERWPMRGQLIDADTGKVTQARLTRVGPAVIEVAGQKIACTHYRLVGFNEVQLWYDGTGRLVRQESIEEGQRTILELQRLERK